MELTDLEICKRIAEIEGVESDFIGGLLCTKNNNGGFGGQYSPLTDDALCFQLMAKYFISVHICGTWFGCYRGESLPSGCNSFLSYELNLKKAICLAIIKAHKE